MIEIRGQHGLLRDLRFDRNALDVLLSLFFGAENARRMEAGAAIIARRRADDHAGLVLPAQAVDRDLVRGLPVVRGKLIAETQADDERLMALLRHIHAPGAAQHGVQVVELAGGIGRRHFDHEQVSVGSHSLIDGSARRAVLARRDARAGRAVPDLVFRVNLALPFYGGGDLRLRVHGSQRLAGCGIVDRRLAADFAPAGLPRIVIGVPERDNARAAVGLAKIGMIPGDARIYNRCQNALPRLPLRVEGDALLRAARFPGRQADAAGVGGGRRHAGHGHGLDRAHFRASGKLRQLPHGHSREQQVPGLPPDRDSRLLDGLCRSLAGQGDHDLDGGRPVAGRNAEARLQILRGQHRRRVSRSPRGNIARINLNQNRVEFIHIAAARRQRQPFAFGELRIGRADGLAERLSDGQGKKTTA